MPELTDFLQARIAEDEADAGQLGEMSAWAYFPYGQDTAITEPTGEPHAEGDVKTVARFGTSGYERHFAITLQGSEGLDGSVNESDGLHIARWDPARVLAECETKRRILALDWDFDEGRLGALRQVELLLALPYADHPDYDETWRP